MANGPEPILILHKAGRRDPGTWFLGPGSCQTPPSAHPFCRVVRNREPGIRNQEALIPGACLLAPEEGLVAQLVRARA
jgi:hypothetical protein